MESLSLLCWACRSRRVLTSGSTAPFASRPAWSRITSAPRPSSPGSTRKQCSRRSCERDGIRRLRHVLKLHVDRNARTVDASAAGLLASHAVFHDGLGCVLLHGSKEPYLLKSDIEALKAPKAPPLLPEIAGSRHRRAARSRIEGRARSRLRGAGGAAVPQDQGGRGGARRQGDRRALRCRHRRRHAAVGLLHDQVGDQRADRHPDPAGPDVAVDAGADPGMARPE